MIILKEKTELDYMYTDYILLKDVILDTSLREQGILNRREIAEQIKARDFDTDPEHFKQSLDTACAAIHGEYLSPRTLSALQRMRTFKIKDLNVGFALKIMKGTSQYSEIVALHNASIFGRLGSLLLNAAEELGGKYLECFGEVLSKQLYTTYGFEVYKTIENVKMRNGRHENLYFMKLKWVPAPKEI